jgi:hypothetical protein
MDDQCVFANAQVTGCFEVEHVAGKSTAVQSFSRYPLKLMVPNKVKPLYPTFVPFFSFHFCLLLGLIEENPHKGNIS